MMGVSTCRVQLVAIGRAGSRETHGAGNAGEVVALSVGEPAKDVEESGNGEKEGGRRGEQVGCHVGVRDDVEGDEEGLWGNWGKEDVERGERRSVSVRPNCWRGGLDMLRKREGV